MAILPLFQPDNALDFPNVLYRNYIYGLLKNYVFGFLAKIRVLDFFLRHFWLQFGHFGPKIAISPKRRFRFPNFWSINYTNGLLLEYLSVP